MKQIRTMQSFPLEDYGAVQTCLFNSCKTASSNRNERTDFYEREQGKTRTVTISDKGKTFIHKRQTVRRIGNQII